MADTLKRLQDTPVSKESIDKVIESICGVLREAYPDYDPDAFIIDIDWAQGDTIIMLGIKHDLTEAQLDEWDRNMDDLEVAVSILTA